MRRLLLFLTILPETVHCSCPSGFELVRDGECRGKYSTISSSYNDTGINASNKCKEIQGLPVIIHNDEHQTYWRTRGAAPDNLFLGIVCNTNSKRWEWADGSALDYRPSTGYMPELDQECVTGWGWDMHPDGYWHNAYSPDKQSIPIYCTTQLHQPTGDGCDSFSDDTEDGICYQIRTNTQNWQDAQTTCRNLGATVASIHNLQENSFIRRSAVSQGAVNGLYLGASKSGSSKYSWIDGSKWDYENFFPGFPADGQGDCLAMDTFSASGEWMNVQCSSRLAVACAKKADPRHECTSGPWKEGQVIYTPGYPYDASTPCDYFLTVASGRKVRVEVMLLEANSCCDRLVMEDATLGGNVVANLTGEINDKYYTTSSSNFMRVSWQPQGGVNVRGAMFTFNAV